MGFGVQGGHHLFWPVALLARLYLVPLLPGFYFGLGFHFGNGRKKGSDVTSFFLASSKLEPRIQTSIFEE